MEFKVERDALYKELGTLRKYLSKTVPILENFLFEADAQAQTITITASDATNINQSTIPAAVTTGGAIVMSSGPLYGYLQNLPSEELDFKEDAKQMKLKCQKKNMKIPIH